MGQKGKGKSLGYLSKPHENHKACPARGTMPEFMRAALLLVTGAISLCPLGNHALQLGNKGKRRLSYPQMNRLLLTQLCTKIYVGVKLIVLM